MYALLATVSFKIYVLEIVSYRFWRYKYTINEQLRKITPEVYKDIILYEMIWCLLGTIGSRIFLMLHLLAIM